MQRVLIANRGEIAIRIAAAAAARGLESVAVYSADDELALHTRAATTAVALPEAADPVSTYLQVDAIVAAACTLNVSEPYMSGIGGFGGFMLIYLRRRIASSASIAWAEHRRRLPRTR